MSNSAIRNGEATLFFTTLTRVRLPYASVPFFERLDPADVDPDRGVELQGAAAGRGLRVAEHDADLLAQLVGEDEGGVRAVHGAGQLAQGLAHEPGLEAHERVAHLALDLGPGHERGDRVDDDHVHAGGADQGLGDLQRLLAGVRLRDQQLVDVDAQVAGVAGVQRVLGVDEGGDAARLLGVGGDVVAEGRLAAGLGAEDLRDPATGHAAHAERQVKRDGTGGHDVHRQRCAVSPSRMIEPWPNCFSIWRMAASTARARSPLAGDFSPLVLVLGAAAVASMRGRCSFVLGRGGRAAAHPASGSSRGLRLGLMTSTVVGS